MRTHFIPFPTLQTERLDLRPLVAEDAPQLFVQRSDPRMLAFVEIVPPGTLEEIGEFIQKINAGVAAGESVFWAVALQNSPELIGTICLWNLSVAQSTAELGYMLHPDFQGQGYMQEALVSVVAYGFDVMQANLIEAFSHPENIPSIRLLERNHFVRTGEVEGYAVFTQRQAFTPGKGL